MKKCDVWNCQSGLPAYPFHWLCVKDVNLGHLGATYKVGDYWRGSYDANDINKPPLLLHACSTCQIKSQTTVSDWKMKFLSEPQEIKIRKTKLPKKLEEIDI